MRIRNDNFSGETRLSCVHSQSQQHHDRTRTKVEPVTQDEKIPKPEINSIRAERTLERQLTFATSRSPALFPCLEDTINMYSVMQASKHVLGTDKMKEQNYLA